MGNKASNYILDSQEESERLERQSRMTAYDFRQELQFLKLAPGQKILDAGCGSGIVSHHLSTLAQGVHIVGWDVSAERVEMAKAQYGEPGKIDFFQKDLLKASANDAASEQGQFDVILCRYVLRHFDHAGAKKVLGRLFEALKPGGTLYCIDLEGTLSEVFPSSAFLKKALAKVRDAKTVDFHVARKIPALLAALGMENLQWHVLTVEFKGQELIQEIENLNQAIDHAKPFIKERVGGAAAFNKLKQEYFEALKRPESVLFYNKVIASGVKPRARPYLIKK